MTFTFYSRNWKLRLGFAQLSRSEPFFPNCMLMFSHACMHTYTSAVHLQILRRNIRVWIHQELYNVNVAIECCVHQSGLIPVMRRNGHKIISLYQKGVRKQQLQLLPSTTCIDRAVGFYQNLASADVTIVSCKNQRRIVAETRISLFCLHET